MSGIIKERLVALPPLAKRSIVLLIDALLCMASLLGAFFLRLDYVPEFSVAVIATYVLVLVCMLPTFAALGMYKAIYRYSGMSSLTTIVQAVLIGAVPVIAIVTMMGLPSVPRSVGPLQVMLLLISLIFTRIAARNWLGESRPSRRPRAGGQIVAVYGAGSAGRQLVSALSHASGMRVAAFLDDDPELQGRTLDRVPVLSPAALTDLVDRVGVTEVLLALPSVGRGRRKEIIATLRDYPVHVQTLPGLADLASGKVGLNDLRELEIEDLLGRDAVAPNAILLSKNIVDRTVLVTGAGGSIGSELCRQILQIGPTTLLLFEASEYALYTIHQELLRRSSEFENAAPPTLVPLLGSVCDRRRLDEVIATWRPHTIYHAAAYKHVPLVEHNVGEGIRNNVIGTLCAADAAREHGVSDFVLISTDKAVRPTNVMGASKRLAELVLQAMAAQPGSTRYSMVRFGNVLGSSGSVVPLFRQQIAEGGPITITHSEITRYFMTIPEAAQLVIQAGAMASGGEVFVLDMGEPVRILDLARRMIELSGLSVRDEMDPDGDIEIVTVGLRPGEKLYEELLIGEDPQPTNHPRIMRANEHFVPWSRLEPRIKSLQAALEAGDVQESRRILQLEVPEYTPSGEVVDLVQRRRDVGR